jgi:hypothetical protein
MGCLSRGRLQGNGVAVPLWARGMAAASNSLHVPAARRRIRRRLVGIRALKADPRSAGQCRPTLLIAREIAGHWSDHPVSKVSCAPLIAGRRLRRCRLHFAKQRREQEKRKNWQAHGRLPVGKGYHGTTCVGRSRGRTTARNSSGLSAHRRAFNLPCRAAVATREVHRYALSLVRAPWLGGRSPRCDESRTSPRLAVGILHPDRFRVPVSDLIAFLPDNATSSTTSTT